MKIQQVTANIIKGELVFFMITRKGIKTIIYNQDNDESQLYDVFGSTERDVRKAIHEHMFWLLENYLKNTKNLKAIYKIKFEDKELLALPWVKSYFNAPILYGVKLEIEKDDGTSTECIIPRHEILEGLKANEKAKVPFTCYDPTVLTLVVNVYIPKKYPKTRLDRIEKEIKHFLHPFNQHKGLMFTFAFNINQQYAETTKRIPVS